MYRCVFEWGWGRFYIKSKYPRAKSLPPVQRREGKTLNPFTSLVSNDLNVSTKQWTVLLYTLHYTKWCTWNISCYFLFSSKLTIYTISSCTWKAVILTHLHKHIWQTKHCKQLWGLKVYSWAYFVSAKLRTDNFLNFKLHLSFCVYCQCTCTITDFYMRRSPLNKHTRPTSFCTDRGVELLFALHILNISKYSIIS